MKLSEIIRRSLGGPEIPALASAPKKKLRIKRYWKRDVSNATNSETLSLGSDACTPASKCGY